MPYDAHGVSSFTDVARGEPHEGETPEDTGESFGVDARTNPFPLISTSSEIQVNTTVSSITTNRLFFSSVVLFDPKFVSHSGKRGRPGGFSSRVEFAFPSRTAFQRIPFPPCFVFFFCCR